MSTRNVTKRVLQPNERVSEILFGLIMVLTFTGSLSVAEADRTEVRTMLIGALGCNLAWGVIDAIFYLMSCLAEKGGDLKTYRAVRRETNPDRARQLMLEAMPSVLASVLQPAEIESMHRRLTQLPAPPEQARLNGKDWRGSAGVFLLVFLSTFPVALPFIFMDSAPEAMRVSNGVAIVLLFMAGFGYGRCVGRSPWAFGFSVVVIGLILVAMTISLGG